jgi:hypothetical protein
MDKAKLWEMKLRLEEMDIIHYRPKKEYYCLGVYQADGGIQLYKCILLFMSMFIAYIGRYRTLNPGHATRLSSVS